MKQRFRRRYGTPCSLSVWSGVLLLTFHLVGWMTGLPVVRKVITSRYRLPTMYHGRFGRRWQSFLYIDWPQIGPAAIGGKQTVIQKRHKKCLFNGSLGILRPGEVSIQARSLDSKAFRRA